VVKVPVKAARSCHHSVEDLQSKCTNFCASKSKCMAYDILHYILRMLMNQLCTDFHMVKLTHSVSVQIYTKTAFWEYDLMIYIYIYIYIFRGATAPSGPEPPHYRGFTITLRHTAVGRTPLDERSALRKDLNLTTHSTHNRHTDLQEHGRFQTHNPSTRAATDPRLRRRGHWDRLFCITDGVKKRKP
jgi:hypothetical protein